MEFITFTRYLYPKIDVKQSLLIALLDRKPKEALFWAYELYYSGDEEDTFDYLKNIYKIYYESENPDVHIKLFAKGTQDDCLIGSIVLTICSRKYQICNFLRIYKHYDYPPIIDTPNKMKFVIAFKEADLKDYLTIEPEQKKARFYLKEVCFYPINRQYNTFFETSCDEYNIHFWYHWLYFASNSPIWMERIKKFGGILNCEIMDVEFPTDDLLEAFYDCWGLEPDEQTKELQEKIIGTCDLQLSMDDFCRNYNK
jgi:hypothetical protein